MLVDYRYRPQQLFIQSYFGRLRRPAISKGRLWIAEQRPARGLSRDRVQGLEAVGGPVDHRQLRKPVKLHQSSSLLNRIILTKSDDRRTRSCRQLPHE